MSVPVDWEQLTRLCAEVPLPDLLRRLRDLLPDGLRPEVWLWDHQRRVVTALGSGQRVDLARVDVIGSAALAVEDLSLHGDHLGLLCVDGPAGGAVAAAEIAAGLAGPLAAAILTSDAVGDAVAVARRARPLTLPAEMQWQMLPPGRLTRPGLTISAAVEPAYETGGDLFDYALTGDRLFLAVLDARGHGLRAATTATVAVSAMRRARRDGADLIGIATGTGIGVGAVGTVDEFVSAVMVELDLSTWTGHWLSAGHLPPLVVGATTEALELRPTLPLGMVVNGRSSEPVVQPFELAPGRSLVLYSDGIIENATTSGPALGDARFHNALGRHLDPDRDAGHDAGRPVGPPAGRHPARDVVEDLLALTGPTIRDDATLLIATRH